MTYYCAVTALTLMSLVALGLHVHENGRLSPRDRRGLYEAYVLIAAACVAEFCGVVLDGFEGLPALVLSFVKCVDYTLTPMAGGALARQLGIRNRWDKALVGVLAANVLLQIVGLLSGLMVVVDAHNHYVHGPLYPAYVLVYLAVLAIVVVQLVDYGKSYSRQNRLSLTATIVLVAMGIALQEVLGSGVRTAYLSLTLGAALLFIHNTEFSQQEQDETIGEQRAQIMTDALTGVMSRYAYAQAIASMAWSSDVPADLVAFTVDLNGLKETNDTLGHDAGDELIRAAADCVARAFANRGTCYRTGGDEFVALARMDRGEADAALHAILRDADAWRGEAVSSMSLAVGYALAADHPGYSLEELVARADRAMYVAKEAHYRELSGERPR